MDAELKFTRLTEQYRKDNWLKSFDVPGHPSMRSIVAMGDEALPYIMRELSTGHGGTEFLAAIREITGKSGPEIAEDERGVVPVLRRKYYEWLKSQGYKSADGASLVRPFHQISDTNHYIVGT